MLVKLILAKKGWFIPPFDTIHSLKETLNKLYEIDDWHVDGSMVYFCATKRVESVT